MIRFKIKKRSRFTASMVACGCFIALAIWGWDLPVSTALSFFLICLTALALIIGIAAGLGWLLFKLRTSKKMAEPIDDHSGKP